VYETGSADLVRAIGADFDQAIVMVRINQVIEACAIHSSFDKDVH